MAVGQPFFLCGGSPAWGGRANLYWSVRKAILVAAMSYIGRKPKQYSFAR